ncbi:hypothetical protein JI742_09825 [Piscinibacter sp. Jin2]|uniref:Bacteriophage tail tape measure N-terminal domain-containing protein n=1 Tax=Aquariibacter lacus TaxID=2801332 RepID=A0A9X0XFY1_9BURK|nr:hypothetical protein [Piscinibacter lacus]MBL0720187.1 hypothetical protein [Piscinibacter lacus]
MSFEVGDLLISLRADLARYQSDMNQSVAMTTGAVRKIEAEAALARKALGGIGTGLAFGLGALGVSLGAAQFVQFSRGVVSSMDALNDLADATGASVEKLVLLRRQAEASGGDVSVLSGAMIRLNAQLRGDDGDSGAALTLRAIGLEAKALREMDPADALLAVSAALNRFEDDGYKARVVQQLFGKSVAEVAPLLKDLQEKQDLTTQATARGSEEAERWNKNLAYGKAAALDYARSLAEKVLPVLNSVAESMRSTAIEDAEASVDKARRSLNLYESRARANPGNKVFFNTVGVGQQELMVAEARLARLYARRREEDERSREQFRRTELGLSAAGKPSIGEVNTDGPASPALTADAKRQAADALREAREAAQGYADTWARLLEIEQQATQQTGSLSAAQKLLADYLGSDAYTLATEGTRQLTLAKAYQVIETERLAAAERELTAAGIDGRANRVDQLQAEAAALEAQVRQQLQANEALGLSGMALVRLEERRILDAAAEQDRLATIADGIDPAIAAEYRRQAQALRDLAAARVAGAGRQDELDRAAEVGRVNEQLRRDEAAAWQRTYDQLGQSLADAIVNGGKGAGELLRSYFRGLVLQPVVRAVGGALGGALGLPGVASASTGVGGGGLGGLGDLAGLARLISNPGAALDAGNASLLGSVSGFSSFLTEAGFAGGGSFFSGIGQGLQQGLGGIADATSSLFQLGQAAGSVAPYLGSIASLLSGDVKGAALGAAGTYIGSLAGPLGALAGGLIGQTLGGLIGSDDPYNVGAAYTINAAGQGRRPTDRAFFAESGLTRSQVGFEDYTKRRSDELDSAAKTLAEALYGTYADLAQRFGREAQALTIGFRANGEKASGNIVLGDSNIVFKTGEDDPAKAFAAFADRAGGAIVEALRKAGLPAWAQEILDAVDASQGAEALQAAAGTIAQIMGMAQALRALPSSNLAELTEAQVLSLAEYAGGLQQLQAGLDAFVGATYSSAEREALARKRLGESLASLADGQGLPAALAGQLDAMADALAGTGAGALTSTASLRALVQALDPADEAQQRLLVGLLGLSDAFAQVTSATQQAAGGVLAEVQRLRGGTTLDDQSSTELQARFALTNAQARAGDRSALERLPEISRALEQATTASAVSALEVARQRAYLRSALEGTLGLLGVEVPAFAAGGMHAGGLRLVGERGPELEATGPARYWTAAQTAQMLAPPQAPAQAAAQAERLAERVASLEAAVRELMQPLVGVWLHTRDTADTLRDAAVGARPITTKTAAP